MLTFRKVKDATIRDSYLVAYIEHLLEWVARKEAYSFIEEFLGYNQIALVTESEHKTTFGLTRSLSTYQQGVDNILTTNLKYDSCPEWWIYLVFRSQHV